MPTNREVFFSSIPTVANSKFLNKTLLKYLIIKANGMKDELELTKNFDEEIKDFGLFKKMLTEAVNGKMVQYITNECNFCGLNFYVDENVLIPRQETEELVEYFKNFFKKYQFNEVSNILDVCTGSGCISIALSNEMKMSNFFATDISSKAIEIAKRNNNTLKTNVNFKHGNLLDPYIGKKVKFDCIIANPPYIQDKSTIDERTWNQEPHLALLADPDTKYYEEILSKAKLVLKEKSLIAFEIGEKMKPSLTKIVKKYFPKAEVTFIKDMDDKYRFLIIYNKIYYKNAQSALADHGVICFPTETVMGLGIVYDDEKAFAKLNAIKRRPENKPYSLMLGTKSYISRYAFVTKREKKVIDAFLPGPLTILLKKRYVPKWVSLDSEFVGIRIPNMPEILKILNRTHKPILAPSANRSGEKPALTYKAAKKIFGSEIDFYVKKDAQNSMPSTIVQITDNDVKIIREGPITKEQILEVLQ